MVPSDGRRRRSRRERDRDTARANPTIVNAFANSKIHVHRLFVAWAGRGGEITETHFYNIMYGI